MLCGLVQMTSSDDPSENLGTARAAIRLAARGGADMVMTPEVTNCLSGSRQRQMEVLCRESEDPVLAGLRDTAAAEGIWLLIGSLALKTGDPDGRFANRSFLIAPDGTIVARYDKIHMFDVNLSNAESYRESESYRPGRDLVVAPTPYGRIGLTICYDVRFPYVYRELTRRGAEILTVPAAFTRPTGAAHWEVLLRARAIETSSFVLAPAQTGSHPTSAGKIRHTWGHSLAISPWGEVLLNMGDLPGVGLVKIDIAYAADAKARVPAALQDVSIGND